MQSLLIENSSSLKPNQPDNQISSRKASIEDAINLAPSNKPVANLEKPKLNTKDLIAEYGNQLIQSIANDVAQPKASSANTNSNINQNQTQKTNTRPNIINNSSNKPNNNDMKAEVSYQPEQVKSNGSVNPNMNTKQGSQQTQPTNNKPIIKEPNPNPINNESKEKNQSIKSKFKLILKILRITFKTTSNP